MAKISSIKKDFPIVKHKELLWSGLALDIKEVRVIDMILGKEYQLERFEQGKSYKLTAEYYAEKCGMSIPDAYIQLKQVAVSLYNASQRTQDPWTLTVTLCRYVTSIKCNDIEQFIEVVWNPDAIPLISGKMERGTFNTFDSNLCLTSSSKRHALMEYLSSRLYEIDKVGSFVVLVHQLRIMLGMVDEYPVFADFKKRVIEPAVKDIEKLTGVRLILTYRRTNRVISKFIVRKDNAFLP